MDGHVAFLRHNKLTDRPDYHAQQLLVKGHAIYHKEFFCGRHDFSILTDLCKELDARGQGLINWSQVSLVGFHVDLRRLSRSHLTADKPCFVLIVRGGTRGIR